MILVMMILMMNTRIVLLWFLMEHDDEPGNSHMTEIGRLSPTTKRIWWTSSSSTVFRNPCRLAQLVHREKSQTMVVVDLQVSNCVGLPSRGTWSDGNDYDESVLLGMVVHTINHHEAVPGVRLG
jgi:hypothetical protein